MSVFSRVAVAVGTVACLVPTPHAQNKTNLTGTWELVREKSSPRPKDVCDPNKVIVGLKGEPCYDAVSRLTIDESASYFSITGVVPFMPYMALARWPGVTTERVTVPVNDEFPRLGVIDRVITVAVRKPDAMVVRAYAPSEAGYCEPSAGFDWDGGATQYTSTTESRRPFGPRPFQAAQCLEQRFTLDPTGNLIVEAKDEFHPHVTQVFHRVR